MARRRRMVVLRSARKRRSTSPVVTGGAEWCGERRRSEADCKFNQPQAGADRALLGRQDPGAMSEYEDDRPAFRRSVGTKQEPLAVARGSSICLNTECTRRDSNPKPSDP